MNIDQITKVALALAPHDKALLVQTVLKHHILPIPNSQTMRRLPWQNNVTAKLTKAWYKHWRIRN